MRDRALPSYAVPPPSARQLTEALAKLASWQTLLRRGKILSVDV
jgi:hypothetical protein